MSPSRNSTPKTQQANAPKSPCPASGRHKVALAKVIHSRTAVSNGWLAEQLKMKSADNVTQPLRRLTRGAMKLDKCSAAWLNKRVREDKS